MDEVLLWTGVAAIVIGTLGALYILPGRSRGVTDKPPPRRRQPPPKPPPTFGGEKRGRNARLEREKK